MRRALTSLVIASVAAFSFGCVARPGPELTAAADRPLYAAYSFFYENGRHLTTNYRKGILIPINTKVRIISSSRTKIRIELAEGGRVIDIINVADYSGEDINGIFGRMFSPAPIDLSRLSDQERGLILAGKVGVGMSRDAVIMALGYPPSHKTPSLQGKAWTYWRNRFTTFVVEFGNGKVVRIRG
jgi:hypothetical protein